MIAEFKDPLLTFNVEPEFKVVAVELRELLERFSVEFACKVTFAREPLFPILVPAVTVCALFILSDPTVGEAPLILAKIVPLFRFSEAELPIETDPDPEIAVVTTESPVNDKVDEESDRDKLVA